VPEILEEPQFVRALDAARTAAFSVDEWDLYIRAGMAIQDEIGKLTMAQRDGVAKGRKEGREEGLAEG